MKLNSGPAFHSSRARVPLQLQNLVSFSQDRKEAVPRAGRPTGWNLPSREALEARGLLNVPITHSLGSLMLPAISAEHS